MILLEFISCPPSYYSPETNCNSLPRKAKAYGENEHSTSYLFGKKQVRIKKQVNVVLLTVRRIDSDISWIQSIYLSSKKATCSLFLNEIDHTTWALSSFFLHMHNNPHPLCSSVDLGLARQPLRTHGMQIRWEFILNIYMTKFDFLSSFAFVNLFHLNLILLVCE